MEINLTSLFDNFYHTRVFVILLLATFTFLLSLRLDNTLTCSYWLIFLPLWIWKAAVFIGMILGSISWMRLARRRFEAEIFIQYKSMILSFTTNLVLLLFELIACDKLETDSLLPWSFCFLPLYLLSMVSAATLIWSIKYRRSYEIELFFSVNLLQFVFIALRLDASINWSWMYVFVPIWMIMFFALIALTYHFILTIVLTCYQYNQTIENRAQQTARNNTINNSALNTQTRWINFVLYTILFSSLLAFMLLLVHKLDTEARLELLRQLKDNFYRHRNYNQFLLRQEHPQEEIDQLRNELQGIETLQSMSFLLVCLPMYAAYLAVICLSFNSSSGNMWWFGLGRRNFCDAFLYICPIFQTYGNINVKVNIFGSDVNNLENSDDVVMLSNSSINQGEVETQDVELKILREVKNQKRVNSETRGLLQAQLSHDKNFNNLIILDYPD